MSEPQRKGVAAPQDVLAFWRAAGPDKWLTNDTAFDDAVIVGNDPEIPADRDEDQRHGEILRMGDGHERGSSADSPIGKMPAA